MQSTSKPKTNREPLRNLKLLKVKTEFKIRKTQPSKNIPPYKNRQENGETHCFRNFEKNYEVIAPKFYNRDQVSGKKGTKTENTNRDKKQPKRIIK